MAGLGRKAVSVELAEGGNADDLTVFLENLAELELGAEVSR